MIKNVQLVRVRLTMTIFAKTLTELRKEAGFETAYQFFHKNGGKKVLKISYQSYLQIEQGRNLPRIDRLGLWLNRLSISKGSVKARMLALAWLKTSVGENNFKDWFLPHVFKQDIPIADSSYPRKALKLALRSRFYKMSLEQTDTIAQTPETYWCFDLLSSHIGKLNIDEIVRILKLNKQKIKKALKHLTKTKLVKEIQKDVFKCPFAGMSFESTYIGRSSPTEEKVAKYRESMKAKGKKLFWRNGVIRADAKAFMSYYSYFDSNIIAARAYETAEKTDNTAFFLVEGEVTKLFDF
ncbi:hypothetical protein ACFL6Y_11460 [Elusimicrobiota bacterium]